MAVSKAKMKNLLGGARPGEGAAPPAGADVPENSAAVKGLVLSEIQFKPLGWFKYNPDNEIFRKCKNEDYFRGLRKDIGEAGAILNPLIAMPDGLIIEGESRHSIAEELCNAGNAAFAKIPVRLILSGLSPEKITERLYLGNLSRFDVPHTVKLFIYSKIWPDYFLSLTDGKETTTKKEITAATGLSGSQIKRTKAVIKKAAEIAGNEKAPLSAEHIEKAQEEDNKKRKRGNAASKEKDFYEYSPLDKFLKAAVLLLFEKKEYTAVNLLANHFLRKNVRIEFCKGLPPEVGKYLEGKQRNVRESQG
jgi:hypothetical protein